ncbi:ankyrin protein [Fusarium mexicanum]|uniref:Ankyrin protein n=1 Tax=Fusarium mexicanum TaxID=751941 RepID=A0A8H5N5R9_9HYPO|nr:ankyrin protein [Fusarium mexicanum]
MASPLIRLDESPYQEFVQKQNDDHNETGDASRTPMKMIDRDGSILRETEDFRLLYQIVLQNDTLALKQYLTVAPWAMDNISALDKTPHDGNDYILLATQNGNLGVLQMLLDRYRRSQTSTDKIRFLKRGYQLLNEAARRGHVEIVQFLLDSQPLYAGIHDRDCKGYTALGSAADIYSVRYTDPADWQDVCVENNEKVMDLLLDYGARASDIVLPMNDEESTLDTVLTLAVQWASPKLINRLIEGGADIQAKVTKFPLDLGFWNGRGYISDINSLFIASNSANFRAVQCLLGGSGADQADMVSSRDSRGSLPIHWATRNQLPDELQYIPASLLHERVRKIASVIELLSDINLATVNLQDDDGNTTLHYATEYFGRNGKAYTPIFELLCRKGADAGIRNKQGQTPLHTLFRRDGSNMPVDAAAVTTLLTHGANVADVDNDGNTPLHMACFNASFSDAVTILLQHGADPTLPNAKKEMPIHRVAQFNCPPSASRGKADEIIRAQDDMLDRIVKARGEKLMDVPNEDGKHWATLIDAMTRQTYLALGYHETEMIYQEDQRQKWGLYADKSDYVDDITRLKKLFRLTLIEDVSALAGLDIPQIRELCRKELPEASKNIEGAKACFIFVADESVLNDIARGVFVIKVVGYDWDEDRIGQGWMRIPTGNVLTFWESLLLWDNMDSDPYREIKDHWFGEELKSINPKFMAIELPNSAPSGPSTSAKH